MSEGARRAALAVHRRAEKVALQALRGVELATVRRVSPLTLELTESSITLGYSDIELSAQVRWWEQNYGLLVGDHLAVAEVAGHSWLALALFTNRDVSAGAKPLKPPAQIGQGIAPTALESSSETSLFTLGSVPAGGGTPSVTWNRHIVKKMQVFDEAGALVGYIPVFGTLP